MTKEEILQAIEEMSVKELAELVAAIEERFGVSAQAVAPVAVAAAPGAGAPAAAEEKTTVDVVLTSVGQQKIQVIKAVKEITGKGLKEAKELVDKLPAVIKAGAEPEEAEEIKKKLEAVGAEVELK
ncbi:50S ribosomal protein L7/L12 [Candidatus Bipolaricaulota bacterium]|nr:50S ribosomal protein L7/L12 [Candidatus Bipolaricaulota bacterium]RLE32150.1 MAG: 50S ribosomal protein L7/L12 [Candidatus Acetothermia bacterium]HDC92847.1 50S ribosomal protein L7/L12 [Candidatus Acetothermia bacterium]